MDPPILIGLNINKIYNEKCWEIAILASNFRIVYEENDFYHINCGYDDDGSHSCLTQEENGLSFFTRSVNS